MRWYFKTSLRTPRAEVLLWQALDRMAERALPGTNSPQWLPTRVNRIHRWFEILNFYKSDVHSWFATWLQDLAN